MEAENNKSVCLSCQYVSPVFNDLTPDELDYFRKISHQAVFNQGEIIFKQGTPLTHIICISGGSAKLYIELSDNRKILLRIILPRDIVGISGINTDDKHHFTLSALEQTNTCFIEIGAFKKVVKQNPTFAYNLIGSVNSVQHQLFEKLKDLTEKNLNGKIANALLYLSKEVYKNHRFETLLSRQDLAEMSSSTRESVVRVLKEFKDQKIIDFHENHFEILLMEKLETIFKFG